jgi:hypothetical protein
MAMKLAVVAHPPDLNADRGFGDNEGIHGRVPGIPRMDLYAINLTLGDLPSAPAPVVDFEALRAGRNGPTKQNYRADGSI